MKSITITLPLPDYKMSGHAKGNWWSKAELTKRMRRDANVEALHQTQGKMKMSGKATVSLVFYLRTKGRRDLLNMATGCKAYIDGIVDAGIITDDDWKVLSVGTIRAELDREHPRVDITITEAP